VFQRRKTICCCELIICVDLGEFRRVAGEMEFTVCGGLQAAGVSRESFKCLQGNKC
jgi:hypothetical protein